MPILREITMAEMLLMHASMQRILLTASLALLLSLTSAPEAEAQDIGGGIGDAITAVALGGTVGLTSLGFAIADVVSFSLDRPYDDGLVVVELLVGTLSIGSGIALACYAPLHHDDSAALPAFGAAFLALGALEIVHSVWSLGQRANAPRLALSPTSDGAFASLSGTF